MKCQQISLSALLHKSIKLKGGDCKYKRTIHPSTAWCAKDSVKLLYWHINITFLFCLALITIWPQNVVEKDIQVIDHGRIHTCGGSRQLSAYSATYIGILKIQKDNNTYSQ